MTGRILGIFLPVFSIAVVGYLWALRVRPDMAVVNRLGMNVVAPALIFSALSSKSFDIAAYQRLMLGSVGVVLGSGLLAWPVARMLRVDWKTFVPPMMFNNCGNMGLPLSVLAFGEAGFGAMVAVFSISNLFQFTLGTWMLDHRARFSSLARNPMVVATFAGFLFAIARPPLPDWVATAFKLTGDALIPIMLLSLGARLTDMQWDDARLGAIGAIVCPLTGVIIALALAPLLGLTGMQRGLLILFGALPPAVLNFMVAEHYRQEPGKVASIVLIGNLLAVAFVPLGLALALG